MPAQRLDRNCQGSIGEVAESAAPRAASEVGQDAAGFGEADVGAVVDGQVPEGLDDVGQGTGEEPASGRQVPRLGNQHVDELSELVARYRYTHCPATLTSVSS